MTSGKPHHSHKKPFDIIAEGSSSSSWWPLVDKLRAFLKTEGITARPELLMVFHRHSPARAVSDRVGTGSLSRIPAHRNAFRATLTLADAGRSP
jgi:hypothetical protein